MIQDLSRYEFLEEFTLYDASYLILGFDPIPSHLLNLSRDEEVLTHQAYNLAKQLMADAAKGALVAKKKYYDAGLVILPPPPESIDWMVTRQALKDWSLNKGKKPPFLFPDEFVPEKKESTLKLDNLLKVLYCVAVDAYGHPSEDKRSTAASDIAKAVVNNGNGFTIGDSTIRDWLKEAKALIPPKTKTGP